MELNLEPRVVRVPQGTNVTLECSYDLPFVLIPMWDIDGVDYRVTELPFTYEANGANITFPAYDNYTIIRCFFDAFNVSTGEFVKIYSNKATINTTPSTGTYFKIFTFHCII